jgi:hypothetical protein
MVDTYPAAEVAGHARAAADAVRAITHLTTHRPAIPAPDLYPVLGQLEELGYRLAQALRQLGVALEVSLGCHDVYQDDPGTDPNASVAQARARLADASASAVCLGRDIGRALNAIAGQGYHDTRSRADR